MKIWLDTINMEAITDSGRTGLIAGVTTNPSILSKATHVLETLEMLLEIQWGPVAVQVTSHTVEEMVAEGKRIAELSPRMVVKVPVNHNGLQAMLELKSSGIPILATGILTPAQALLAYNLEAEYIAPYYGHMENALENLKNMIEIRNRGYSTRILAAALREVEQVVQCAQLGVDDVTIKDDLYYKLVADHPATESFCKKFAVEWSREQGEQSIKEVISQTKI